MIGQQNLCKGWILSAANMPALHSHDMEYITRAIKTSGSQLSLANRTRT